MTLSQEPAISLCNLTTVFNRCILKESGSLPGSFSRPDPWSRKALRVDRTAAAWKQVAYATRRRRRNPASGIPFTRVMSQSPSLLETLANTAITGKMRSILSRIRPDPWSRKALRVDRTAAAWKQVAYAIRRRRRNPASGIPFTRAKCAAFCPVLDQIPGREKPSVFDQLPGRA